MDDTYIFPPAHVEDEKLLIANVINNQLSSDDTSVSSAAVAGADDVLWDEDDNNDNEDINVMDEDESIMDSDSEDEDDVSDDDEYPYYESEDEDDGDVLTEEVLAKIKDNNPEITKLVVRSFTTAVPAKVAGIYLGQNTNLKKHLFSDP